MDYEFYYIIIFLTVLNYVVTRQSRDKTLLAIMSASLFFINAMLFIITDIYLYPLIQLFIITFNLYIDVKKLMEVR